MPLRLSSRNRPALDWARIGLSCVLLLTVHWPAFAQDVTGPEPTIVRPTDRLAWRQSVPSLAAAEAYLFVAYVDEVLEFLQDTVCEPATDDPFAIDCTAALPELKEGQQRIAITALNNEHQRLESELSDPVLVVLSTTASMTPTEPGTIGSDQTASAMRAGEFHQAIDLAVVRTGLVAVAERRGRILGVQYDDQGSGRVEEWTAAIGPGSEWLTIAATGRHLFAVSAHDGAATLVRYAIARGGLTDRSILLDGLPVSATDPAAALRQGPDGKLYLALGADLGDMRAFDDVGSWRGKILRLNADGTLSQDVPSVVYGASAYRPLDLTWQGSTLWLLGKNDPATTVLAPVRPFWLPQPSTARGVSLPDAFGAHSLAISANGDLVVSGWSIQLTIPGSQGDSVTTSMSAPGLESIKTATDVSKVYFLTSSQLVVRPILKISQ